MNQFSNQLLAKIQDYPFERLAKLLPNFNSNPKMIKMHIGEPILTPPTFVGEIILKQQHLFGKYPTVMGILPLREAIYNYLEDRYDLTGVSLDFNQQIVPTVGSREGLYIIGHLLGAYPSANPQKNIVLCPNPFYQVYKAMALLNKGELHYLNATLQNHFQPDISELDPKILEKTKLAIICNPSNPQGASISLEKLVNAVQTARKYNFVLFLDECYTDLYNQTKPFSGIDAVKKLDGTLDNVVISQTLSKRSSAVGLRSGFLTGDKAIMQELAKMRSYTSPVMPEPIMHASVALWNDRAHVEENRKYYQANFKVANEVFKDHKDYIPSDGAIYLWLPVANSEEAALKLWQEINLSCLPGNYLCDNDSNGVNPGTTYIRITLNADAKTYEDLLPQVKACLSSL